MSSSDEQCFCDDNRVMRGVARAAVRTSALARATTLDRSARAMWAPSPRATAPTSRALRRCSGAVRDPWDVLRVERGASENDVKTAYHKRALETHPDCGGNADDFKLVARAYACLAGGGGGGEAAFRAETGGGGGGSGLRPEREKDWRKWSQRDAEALFRSLFGEKVEFAEYAPRQAIETVDRAVRPRACSLRAKPRSCCCSLRLSLSLAPSPPAPTPSRSAQRSRWRRVASASMPRARAPGAWCAAAAAARTQRRAAGPLPAPRGRASRARAATRSKCRERSRGRRGARSARRQRMVPPDGAPRPPARVRCELSMTPGIEKNRKGNCQNHVRRRVQRPAALSIAPP